MIDFDFSKNCCGCGVCVDSCPQKCISIVEDEKDFRIPIVNVERCINCGLCEKVCPVVNSEAPDGLEKLYCCYNKDAEQRKAGSSGSVFVLLAENILKNGGVVVGASFDDKLQLRHQMAYEKEGIKPLMKSKYIQSDTTGIFSKVKSELKNGRKCLFVGTPCQCQALFNFLGRKQYENLLLVDFICHGVPSQKLFDKAIQSFEKKRNCKVTAFNFREKAKGVLRCYSITYNYNDDKEMEVDIGLPRDFPYFNAYLRYIIFRDICYECPFARKKRVSDITLGDFWYLTKIKKDITDFRKGYSMVIVNSEKGQENLEMISANISKEEYPIDIAVKYNYAYTHSTKKRIFRKWFMRDYNSKSFDYVEEKHLCSKSGLRHDLLMFIINKLKL